MWSSMRICGRGLTAAHALHKYVNRSFMSNNFQCRDAWVKRLSSPILSKVKLGDMFFELDQRLNDVHGATAVDIDIYANAVADGEHLDELEDVLHRFRRGVGSHKMLSSTHHAVVRAFLDFGDESELLRILNDRLNYGIFPDDYTNLLLLDHFVKKEDFRSAAKVACMRMLQEDFANPLINYASLYSCHRYLLNPVEWEPSEEPIPDDDDDDEVIKVRVKYIRNPFFDDHFDLRDPNALIGKTFHLTGRYMDDNIGRNYRAAGLVLHQKWDEAKLFISEQVDSNTQLYSSAIDVIDKFIGGLPEEQQKPLDSLKEVITAARSAALPNDLLTETSEKVKSLVQTEEQLIIKEQCQVFVDWENQRENILKSHLEEIRKKEQLDEVEKKKEQLIKEEEEIFFFDNEDSLDLRIESKKRGPGHRKPYPGKKRKKREADVEYVPPEITVHRPWAQ